MKPLHLSLIPLLALSTLAQQPPVPANPQPVAPAPVVTPTPTPAATEDLPVAKAIPAGDLALALKLQIFLDQQNFGPGKIDGRAKEFTLKALGRYQKAHGQPVTATLEDAEKLPLEGIAPIYTSYTIAPDDLHLIGDVPRKPEQQAKLKKMLYPSLLIYVAERYHSDPDFLAKINQGANLEALKPGDTVFVPNVVPFKIEDVKEIGRLPVIPEYKSRLIHIDTKEKILDLTEGEKLLASYPITPGSQQLPAPAGTWKILGIATLPWFRHDEGVLNHGVRTDNFYNIPAGPSNPVGVLWCGLNRPGIGVHGTNQPFTIGRAGSHGCIRLANWDAIRLSTMITEGMTVVIDDGSKPAPPPVLQSTLKPTEPPSTAPAGKPSPKPEDKLSSNPPLTVSAVPATKNAPQIPSRETKYANH